MKLFEKLTSLIILKLGPETPIDNNSLLVEEAPIITWTRYNLDLWRHMMLLRNNELNISGVI